MTMPCRWRDGGLGDFAGRVRFRRRFGYPGRIDSYERVWLTFAGIDGMADVRLNGQPLGRRQGASGPFEFEISGLLGPRNELAVEVESTSGHGGLWGEVALEVRCTAFLRGVRVWTTPENEPATLHVAGEVVGTSERPLELYVLWERSTVSYTVVEPAPEGRAFQVTAEGVKGPGAVRIELVNGAVVWYALERALGPEGSQEP